LQEPRDEWQKFLIPGVTRPEHDDREGILSNRMLLREPLIDGDKYVEPSFCAAQQHCILRTEPALIVYRTHLMSDDVRL
jgi:hypothetical protein